MSVDKPKFWSRVGLCFRSPGRAEDGAFESHSDVMLDSEVSELSPPNQLTSANDSPSRRVSRLKFSQRETAIERLEEGYEKVIELIESIQRHLVVQEERSASVASSLSQLADSLRHMPDATESQRNLLGSIAERAESQAVCLRRLEENLAQLPHLADAQRETLAAISHQLDSSRQSSDRVSGTLELFNDSMVALSGSTQNAASAFERLHAEASARDERVARLLYEQTKRFTVFAGVAVGVAVLAGIIGLVALLR